VIADDLGDQARPRPSREPDCPALASRPSATLSKTEQPPYSGGCSTLSLQESFHDRQSIGCFRDHGRIRVRRSVYGGGR
jgi:hypothetical protein